MRDFHRAELWLQGHPIWVGSDTLGGWFAMGPLYYWLILPVVALGGSIKTVAIYTLICNALSYFSASFLLNRISRFPQMFFLGILLSLNFPMSSGLWITNAAFIVILMPLACWALWRLHWERNTRDLPRKALLLFTIGILSHVHTLFLAFIPLGVALSLPAKTGWKDTLVQIPALLVGGLSPILPFALAFLNDRYGRPFGGPYFHSLDERTGSYFLDTYLYLIESGRFGEFGPPTRVRIEMLVVFGASILAIGATLLTKTEAQLKKCAVWLLAALILLAPYVFHGSGSRYSLLWFLPTIYGGLLFIAEKINTGKTLHHLAISAVSTVLAAGSLMLFPKSWAAPKTHATLTLADMEAACEYFNDQLVAYNQFAANMYEMTNNSNDSSILYSEFCFRKKSEEPKTSPQYLVVQRIHATVRDVPRLVQLIPAEIRPLYPPKDMKKILETPNLFFYESPGDNADAEIRRTHSYLQYQIDPALSVPFTLRQWADAKSFFAGQPVQFAEARLCEEPLFCSLYMLSSFQNNELKVAIVSRILQTKYIPPMAGAVENLALKLKCDDDEMTIPLASLVGVRDPSYARHPSATFFTPIWLKKSLKCQRLSLDYLYGDQFYLNGVKSELPPRFLIESTQDFAFK